MPKRSTVEAFVATVESNKHVDAILNFYAPDARTHENNNPPVVGRDVLAEKERNVLARVAGVETTRLSPIFVEGDHSAVWWCFAFTAKDGTVRTMEEMALQTWRGEELIEERFFYDPSQMKVSK